MEMKCFICQGEFPLDEFVGVLDSPIERLYLHPNCLDVLEAKIVEIKGSFELKKKEILNEEARTVYLEEDDDE